MANNSANLCTESCLLGRKTGKRKDAEMLRCCLCMNWFHMKCIQKEDPDASTTGIWNCFTCRMMPSLISDLVQTVNSLKQEVSSLSLKYNELKAQNETLVTIIDAQSKKESASDPSPTVSTPDPCTYSSVVASSVRTALRDEKARNDVIISRIKESANCQDTIRSICSKIEYAGLPNDVVRIGRKKEGRDRPMKVTFATSFDARRFCSRLNEKKGDSEDISEIRVRLGKTKSELDLYMKNKNIAINLNKEAKEKNENVSYSLRDNGEIWKYKKQDNDKWIKEADWAAPEECNQGNGQN